MSRFSFLVMLVVGQLFFNGVGFAAERPNIVLIIADDMGCDDCGAYGHPTIRTPNIDRLGREGLRFEQAFLTCSSCSPSRASLITGRYPHATGAEQLHWPVPGDQVTFVERLRAAGYWTAAAGKWHLGSALKKRFDLIAEAGTAGFQLPTGKDEKEVEKPAQAKRDGSGCEDWVATLRARPEGKPFFLWLAAVDPHRDYASGTIDKPHSPDDVRVPPYLPDVAETRRDFAQYYDEIARLDLYVGRVLEELNRQGVAQNTLVLFMTDNGRPFPRCKTTVYDSGIRTPLLARWPARIKPNGVTASLVSSVDISATLMELGEATSGPTFQGRSFASAFSQPEKPQREFAFAEHNWHDFEARSRAARSPRFKYIRNEYLDLPNTPPADAVRSPTFQIARQLRDAGKLLPEQLTTFTKPLPAEELYDTEADPHELKNLALDPVHQPTLATHRAVLDAWKKETDDVAPQERTPDEFNRETGIPFPDRKRPRGPAAKR